MPTIAAAMATVSISFSSTSLRQDVPVFDNKPSSYGEFRKRALLFRARLKLDERANQAVLLLIDHMTGPAWEACESLADDLDRLEEDDAFDKLLV